MQYSLFGADLAPAGRDDLDGLLLAGAHWVRAGTGPGERARLSVLVQDPWRVDALIAELARRDLETDTAGANTDGRFTVRTQFRPDLVAAAVRWTRGSRAVAVPEDVVLTPGGLRLWAMVGGRRDDSTYLLATADAGDPLHRAAGARLSALGVAAISLGERGGPGWRVAGRKRLRRLAELVGEPPAGAGDDWPVAD